MNYKLTTLERAFEIARGGHCTSVTQLRAQLDQERYDTRQIEGRALSKQLGNLIQKALAKNLNAAPPIG